METLKPSPFHPGERALQKSLGLEEKMQEFGQRVIRDHMPEQHRNFYEQLNYVFIGYSDNDGWPWASILFGQTGFIASPHKQSLVVNVQDCNSPKLFKGDKVALLGLDLSKRRRNRLSATVSEQSNSEIHLQVRQSFGNCPKYIQIRDLKKTAEIEVPTKVQTLKHFDNDSQQIIKQSDTFFVATYIDNGTDEASEGADVSHRGGKPGFVTIENNSSLLIPDYSGNKHFNTLGNILSNGKAGLLFIDFERGHLLSVTGHAEVITEHPDMHLYSGAERLWRFTLKEGIKTNHALPLRWELNEYSPYLPQ